MAGDLGLEQAYSNDAFYQLLAQRRAESLQNAIFAETQRKNQADEALRQQQIESATELKRQAELDRQQRDSELSDTRNENATTRAVNVMPRGAVVTPTDYGRFSKYGYGSLFQPQDAQPALPDDFQGPLPDGQTRSAMPGGFRFMGTANQDLADERAQTQRQIAAERAQAAATRQADLNDYRNSLLDIRERNLERLGGQFDQTHPQDDPQFPNGVKNYVVQLRAKYGNDLASAEQEFGRAMPDLSAAHPNLDATRALNTLRQSFGAAPGASKLDQVLQDLGVGRIGGGSLASNAPRIMTGGGRAASPTGAPSSGGSLRAASVQPNQIVTLKNGQRVRVSKTYPDGTFDYDPVK